MSIEFMFELAKAFVLNLDIVENRAAVLRNQTLYKLGSDFLSEPIPDFEQ